MQYDEFRNHLPYPAGFYNLSVGEQLELWRKIFPKFDSGHALGFVKPVAPREAEAWGVIPKFSRLDGYCRALEKILGFLKQSSIGKFENRLANWTGRSDWLRVPVAAQRLWDKQEALPGDFACFPFQFGLRHAGKSIRRAQVDCTDLEVGLGPYEVGALLLLHPNRIVGLQQMYPASVAEYSPEFEVGFHNCLGYSWDHVSQCPDFGRIWDGDEHPGFGLVTGFLQ